MGDIIKLLKQNKTYTYTEERDFLSPFCKKEENLKICSRLLYAFKQKKDTRYLYILRNILSKIPENTAARSSRRNAYKALFYYADRHYNDLDKLSLLDELLSYFKGQEQCIPEFIYYFTVLLDNKYSDELFKKQNRLENVVAFVKELCSKNSLIRPLYLYPLLRKGPIGFIIDNYRWFLEHYEIFDRFSVSGAENQKLLQEKALNQLIEVFSIMGEEIAEVDMEYWDALDNIFRIFDSKNEASSWAEVFFRIINKFMHIKNKYYRINSMELFLSIMVLQLPITLPMKYYADDRAISKLYLESFLSTIMSLLNKNNKDKFLLLSTIHFADIFILYSQQFHRTWPKKWDINEIIRSIRYLRTHYPSRLSPYEAGTLSFLLYMWKVHFNKHSFDSLTKILDYIVQKNKDESKKGHIRAIEIMVSHAVYFIDKNNTETKDEKTVVNNTFKSLYIEWEVYPRMLLPTSLVAKLPELDEVYNYKDKFSDEDLHLIYALKKANMVPTFRILKRAKERGIDAVIQEFSRIKKRLWNEIDITKSKNTLAITMEYMLEANRKQLRFENFYHIIEEIINFGNPIGVYLFPRINIKTRKLQKIGFSSSEKQIINTLLSKYLRYLEYARGSHREPLPTEAHFTNDTPSTPIEELFIKQKLFDKRQINEEEMLKTYIKFLITYDLYTISILSRIKRPKWLIVFLTDVIPLHAVNFIKARRERIFWLKEFYEENYKEFNLNWESFDTLVSSLNNAIRKELKERKKGFKRRWQKLGKLKNIVEIRLESVIKDAQILEGILNKNLRKSKITGTITFTLIPEKTLIDLFAGVVSSDCTISSPKQFLNAFLQKAWNIKIIRKDTSKWVGNLYLLDLHNYWIIDALQMPSTNYIDLIDFWKKVVGVIKEEANKRGKTLLVSTFLSNYIEIRYAFKTAFPKSETISLDIEYPEMYQIFESSRRSFYKV